MTLPETVTHQPRYQRAYVRGSSVPTVIALLPFLLLVAWFLTAVWGPTPALLFGCFTIWRLLVPMIRFRPFVLTSARGVVIQGGGRAEEYTLEWGDIETVGISRELLGYEIRIIVAAEHSCVIPGYGHMHGRLLHNLGLISADDLQRLLDTFEQAQVMEGIRRC